MWEKRSGYIVFWKIYFCRYYFWKWIDNKFSKFVCRFFLLKFIFWIEKIISLFVCVYRKIVNRGCCEIDLKM